MVTPRLVSLGLWRTHDCSDDDVCLVCGRARSDAGPPVVAPARTYHCPACDIFGKGLACWGCGTTEVEWGVTPRHDYDMTV